MIRRSAGDSGRYTRAVTTQPRPAEPSRLSGGRLDVVTARHLRTWIAIVFAAAAVGTAGYVALERWTVDDALYMTVMALTTVGFREVHDLDTAGRAWTMLVSIAGVGIIFGTVGLVAEAILAEVASGRREAKRMERAVAELRDHFIVCGYGRVGSMVARELVHGGQRRRRRRHPAGVARDGAGRRPPRRRRRRHLGPRAAARPASTVPGAS